MDPRIPSLSYIEAQALSVPRAMNDWLRRFNIVSILALIPLFDSALHNNTIDTMHMVITAFARPLGSQPNQMGIHRC